MTYYCKYLGISHVDLGNLGSNFQIQSLRRICGIGGGGGGGGNKINFFFLPNAKGNLKNNKKKTIFYFF